MSNVSTSTAGSLGALGGLSGALVMGAVAYMMPIPNTGGAPFFVAAAMLMGMGPMSWVAGWALHLVTGSIIGILFGLVLSKLRPGNKAKTIGLGVVAGVVAWTVFFIPMMAMLMPSLMSMGVMVGGSLAAHLVFGLVLGTVATATITKGRKPVTMAAGNNPTQQQPFSCPACGASFANQTDLTNHQAKAHQM
jgi:hypothetical protein